MLIKTMSTESKAECKQYTYKHFRCRCTIALEQDKGLVNATTLAHMCTHTKPSLMAINDNSLHISRKQALIPVLSFESYTEKNPECG